MYAYTYIHTRVKANTFFTTPVELCTAFIMGIKCENSDRLAEMKGAIGELQNVRLIKHKSHCSHLSTICSIPLQQLVLEGRKQLPLFIYI